MFGSTENRLYFIFISCFLWVPPPKNLFGFVFCSQYWNVDMKTKYENNFSTFLDSGKWVQLHIFQKLNSSGPTTKCVFFSFMIQIADISLPDFIFPLYPTLSHYIRPKPIKQTFNCLRFSVSFGWWFLNASCWFWIIARLLFLCMLAEELFLVVMGLRLGYDFMILVECFSWLEQSR